MLEKTMEAFKSTMDIFDKEMKQAFKKFHGKIGKGTRIKIKEGSIININGASARLLNTVTVVTEDPDTLMCKNKNL